MEDIMDERRDEPTISIPAKYWPGVSYTSATDEGASLAPDQLESVPVGIQEHAVDKTVAIVGAQENIPTEIKEARKALKEALRKYQGKEPVATDAELLFDKLNQRPAHKIAHDAQKKRVSRRLLLAERSKKLTIVCPVTGIVSLIELPAIPYKTLVYSHPLSDLDNCRGIAQQGIDYLRRLDTQTLAGILIVLADSYELFKFQPFDSGAQKNAILRTGGKDSLIDAILTIENLVHSANCYYLPKLSLVLDSNMDQFGLVARLPTYLKELAEAIAKPDKEAYDPTIKKVGKPLYIRDVEKAERKVSFLARQEISKAKKQLAEDRKAGKLAIVELAKLEKVTDKLKVILGSLMADDAMLTVPSEMIGLICMKLETYTSNPAKTLLEILRRDRKALLLDVAELEETLKAQVEDDEPEEQDDPAPGNEPAIEDETAETSEPLEDHTGIDSEYMGNDLEPIAEAAEPELVPPQGMSKLEQILWKKKMLAAQAKPRNIVQTQLPSTVNYVPAATSGHSNTANVSVVSYSYSPDRLHIIGTLSNNKRIYFILDNYGTLVPVKFFSIWDGVTE